jgi:tetratricopeptide (TPR) repeat protein
VTGLIDPRVVKVRAGGRGSGWAIGRCGVLTARHVVAPFLEGRAETCLAVLDPRPGTEAFDCVVAWEDPGRDLAVLRVGPTAQVDRWRAVIAEAEGVVLAEPGTEAVEAEAVGYPDAALAEGGTPQPDLAPGRLLPAQGELSGSMAFDVDSSVPDEAPLWRGFSGAAVRDAHRRVIGVVTSSDRGRARRRLHVAALPDPARDPTLEAALTAVGQPAFLEAPDAPAERELLSLLDRAGRPFPAQRVPELSDLGTRRSRADIDIHGDVYYPYVSRDRDRDLRAGLDRRLHGAERRALLLVGDAMAGKSRTLAEAVRRHPQLAGWPVLRPYRNTDLRRIVTGRRPQAVVWLDDINTFTSGVDEALRTARDTPGRIVVGTLRSDQLRLLRERPDMRGVWDALTDESLVELIELSAEWTEEEQERLVDLEPAIREVVADGHALGEALGAAEELQKKLMSGTAIQRAVAGAVIDWPRTGLPAAVPLELLDELWPAYLTEGQKRRVTAMAPEARTAAMEQAVSWACAAVTESADDPFAAAPAIVRRAQAGLVAEDYFVGLRTRAESPVPAAVWDRAVAAAADGDDAPSDLGAVAFRAATAGVLEVAERAWTPLSDGTHGAVDLVARRNLGLVLKLRGRVEEAERLFRRVMESYDPNVSYRAGVSLGILLRERGDTEGARAAFTWARDGEDPEQALVAAANLGHLRASTGDLEGAEVEYRRVIDSGYPDHAPAAAVDLAVALREAGELDRAVSLYELASESGHPEYAPVAMVGLGYTRSLQGDGPGAEAAYRRAIQTGHPGMTPLATYNLGLLLAGRGETDGARAMYELTVASGHPERMPAAAVNLGYLLASQGEGDAAVAAYRVAIESAHPEQAPLAATNLGPLLAARGDVDGARAAYELAIASGLPDRAPISALNLGLLLATSDDVEGARTAYRSAIDSGDPEYAPRAAFSLGHLLAEHHDAEGAAVAYRTAVASGHAVIAPMALVNLAVVLADEGDVDAAAAAYREAIASGDPEQAPMAAVNLGSLLAGQGDPGGAEAAYRIAIDSGHPWHGPTAQVDLGLVHSERGDLDAAESCLRAAIDAGDDDVRPWAWNALGYVLVRRGDADGARAAFRTAIDAGHPQYSPDAWDSMGEFLRDEGDLDGAEAAFREAIASGSPRLVPESALKLGDLLVGRGDPDGARSAYRTVIESDDVVRAAEARTKTADLEDVRPAEAADP